MKKWLVVTMLAGMLIPAVHAARRDKIDCDAWRSTERQYASLIINGFDAPPDCVPNSPECVIMLAKHRKYLAGMTLNDESEQQAWNIDEECGTVLYILNLEVEKMVETALSLSPSMQMVPIAEKDALVNSP